MYRCEVCHERFNSPAVDRVENFISNELGSEILYENRCPFCGENSVEEFDALCDKCRREIEKDETAYDGMCPDCFRTWVLELLETSPRIVAEALGVEVEKP